MPVYRTVVKASWTYDLYAKNKDAAYEMVAADLHKCTIANMDDGTFFIEEPIQEKMKFDFCSVKLVLKTFYYSLFKKKNIHISKGESNV